MQTRYEETRMVLNQANHELCKEKNELYEMFVENKGVLRGYNRDMPTGFVGSRGTGSTDCWGQEALLKKALKRCQQIADYPWMPINGCSIVTKHL